MKNLTFILIMLLMSVLFIGAYNFFQYQYCEKDIPPKPFERVNDLGEIEQYYVSTKNMSFEITTKCNNNPFK